MMNKRFTTFSLIASLALASCSGGSGTGSIPHTPSSAAKAQFVVHWPKKSTTSGRRTQSISPSAQSISISVNNGTAQVTNNPGGGTSNITIDAPVGTDTFLIKAWDLPGAQGNVLDAVTTSQNIVANATNVVNATLDGICAALLIVPSPNQPFAETNSSTVVLPNGQMTSILNSLRIVGTAPEIFTVTPVDADGNAYVSSAGPPVLEVTESGTTRHVSIASSTSGGVTTFTLTPLVGEPTGQTTTLTVSSSQCGGGTPFATNSVTLGVVGAVYVGDTNSVFAYDQDGTALATVNTGYPIAGIAFDTVLNQLDVVTKSGPTSGFGQLYQYSPIMTQTATGTFNVTLGKASKTICNALGQIAVNPSSNILVVCPSLSPGTNAGHVRVVSVSSSGGVATTTDITPASPKWTNGGTPLYNPTSILVEPGGNTVVGDVSTNGYYFDVNGNYLNATYSSQWTSFAYDSQLGDLVASYNVTSLYLLAFNPQTYLNSFNSLASINLLTYNPANQYIYGLNTTGNMSVYNINSSNGTTLQPVPVTGFTGLLAPAQFTSTF